MVIIVVLVGSQTFEPVLIEGFPLVRIVVKSLLQLHFKQHPFCASAIFCRASLTVSVFGPRAEVTAVFQLPTQMKSIVVDRPTYT